MLGNQSYTCYCILISSLVNFWIPILRKCPNIALFSPLLLGQHLEGAWHKASYFLNKDSILFLASVQFYSSQESYTQGTLRIYKWCLRQGHSR